MGIAAFILVLAVINFINLSTAMAIRRAKEVGVRKVLGSGRMAIILQFLVETALITGCALIIATLVVRPLITLFHSFLPSALEFRLFTPAVLFFLICMTIVTTLLSGLYPAKVLSAWLPVLCLKGTASPGPNEKVGLRKSLIIFQFTISLIFIICTLVIGRQINYMRTQDLGFSTEAILNINADPGDMTQNSKRLALLIQQIPGVDLVAREAVPPATDMHTGFPVTYKGKHPVDIPGRRTPLPAASRQVAQPFPRHTGPRLATTHPARTGPRLTASQPPAPKPINLTSPAGNPTAYLSCNIPGS